MRRIEMRRTLKAALLGGATALVMTGADAAAQERAAPGTQLEEIVVTATRQEQALSDVPVSVAAYTQERMDRQGVKSIADVARLTPGLVFTQGAQVTGPARTSVAIRGIASGVGAQTTGVYLDDTPIQARNSGFTSTNVYPEIFDLSRIEVLRGPQGTLFGAGSQGGTVRFITPDPSLTNWSGYGRVEGSVIEGGAAGGEAGVAVGGPIVDGQLGFRASAFFRKTGGYVDRVDRLNQGEIIDRNSNRSSATVVRMALAWAPTENLHITPSVYAQDLRSDNSALFWVELSNPSEAKYKSANLLPSPGRDRFVLPAIKIAYAAGPIDLIYNASYFYRGVLNNPDYSQYIRSLALGNNELNAYPKSHDEYTQGVFTGKHLAYTQELRAEYGGKESRLRAIGGVFWQWSRQGDWEQLPSPNFATWYSRATGVDYRTRFPALDDVSSVFTDDITTHDKQLAIFGEAQYRITEKLTAIAGVRVSRVEFVFANNNAGPFGGAGFSSGKQSETPVTPKFGLTYDFDDANMAYVTAAKGFRPGGAQRPPPVACLPSLNDLGLTTAPDTYDADSVWSYELGSKNRLFNNRLQVDASVFRIDWTDRQSSVALPSCGQNFITNLGDVRSEGFDLAFQARITDNFTLSGAVGYVNARYMQEIRSGTRLVAKKGTPIGQREWVASLSGEYTFVVLDQDGYFRADYQYQGPEPDSDPDLNGFDALIPPRGATDVANLRLGVLIGNADVSLFLKNAFNSHDLLAYSHPSRRSLLFYANTYQPRTVGITATYRY